jgi:hypothetical protein
MTTETVQFLGDGLYAAFDGFGIELRANDPTEPTDRVYLEYDVMRALVKFADLVFDERDEDGDE